MQRLFDPHRNARPPVGRPTGRGALDALVKARDLYALEKVMCAPYVREQLNILRGSRRPLVKLGDTLPRNERLWWGVPDRYMPEDFDVAEEAGKGVPDPYWDPVLKNDLKTYLSFLYDLNGAGVLTYRRRARCQVGIFFVRKSNGDLSMVVDSRKANVRFRRPPKTRLVLGSTFGEVLLPSGETLFISGADVVDCFYNFSCDNLSEFFGLNAVKAGDVGFQELEGVPCHPDELISPALTTVLPMGFSWALHLAQAAVQEVRRRADPEAHDVQDGKVVPPLLPGNALATTYVDNLLFFLVTLLLSNDTANSLSRILMLPVLLSKNALSVTPLPRAWGIG